MAFNPIETFLQEADELLAEIEQSALLLGRADAPAETINQIFRAFHTIKGSGAMCGFDRVAGFTHSAESLLDRVREGAVQPSPELVKLVLAAKDHVLALLGTEQGGAAVANETTAALAAQFVKYSGEAAPAVAHAPVTDAASPVDGTAERAWRILFRPDPGLFACGGNPLLLLQDLRGLGPCEVEAHTDQIPPLEEIRPDECYLWWTVTLRTTADAEAIHDIFIFVADRSEIEIQPVAPAPEIARASGRETQARRDEGVQKALAKEQTVRVPSGRLDRLVNLVGELVMNQSRLSQAALECGAAELANPVQEFERLVAELRDNVLGIRMLPIGTIFRRFTRLVHDLSAELGKEVDLVTEGAETELDKSILDQLAEPLVHVLRNSIDHGIETAQERIAKGKTPRGTIRLAAVHTGANVVISVEDDGRGIHRAAVRAKAIEKGLIAPDAALSDKETLNLILLPGFSTAEQVTSVSGRGVGMDAVRKQIESLRGSISIASDEGAGSRMAFTLPLTLAIIEGLLVEVGADQFIIPMSAILENVELHREDRRRNNGRNTVAVRGELTPYIDLRSVFEIGGEAPPIEKVVIVRHEDARVGLVVERVLGTHQTVIQSLGKFYRNVSVVSGATIMGDGRVAVILDIAAVVRHVESRAAKPAGNPAGPWQAGTEAPFWGNAMQERI